MSCRDADHAGEARGFRHEAVIYGDEGDFLAATAPFLRGALEAGQPALVAVGPENTALLEGELGADAHRVRFADMQALGRNPARIIPYWREFVDEHGGRPVRGIGEPVWPGRGPAEIDECRRHEALLNVAFGDDQAWSLLCPYDGRALDDGVLAKVADSHRAVTLGGISEESATFPAADDHFAGDLGADPAPVAGFEFGVDALAQVRARVRRAAEAAGLDPAAASDVVVAASELAANSATHGGGRGMLRVWREDGRLLVQVEDRGSIDAPLVGRVRPTPRQERGRGLWMVNALCDLVQIRSGPEGTKIRLHREIP